MLDKVLLITNIIAPYRIPVFNELAKVSKFDFEVLFSDWNEPRRKWEIPQDIHFRYSVLEGLRLVRKDRILYLSPRLLFELFRKSPKIILTGGYSIPTLYVWLYCKFFSRKAKYVLFGESTQESEAFINISGVQKWLRRLLVKDSSGYLGASIKAKEYFINLGAIQGKVATSLLTIDMESFVSSCQKFRLLRDAEKEKIGLPELNILFSGRLVETKGVDQLLKAFHFIANEFPNVGLILLGDGEKRQELEQYCENYGLRNVFFMGFRQQIDLPYWYAMADIFVLPSTYEPFGVVIVEAIAAGLPIITSEVVGAAQDLVFDGKNGYIVPPANVEVIAEKLRTLLSDHQLRSAMAQASVDLQKKCSLKKAVDGFIKVIEIADASNY